MHHWQAIHTPGGTSHLVATGLNATQIVASPEIRSLDYNQAHLNHPKISKALFWSPRWKRRIIPNIRDMIVTVEYETPNLKPNHLLIFMTKIDATAKRACRLSTTWMKASRKWWLTGRINSPRSRSVTLMESPRAPTKRPSVYRSKRNLLCSIYMTWLQLSVSFQPLTWHMTQMEYSKKPL